jgi:site-specific DNA recombinase
MRAALYLRQSQDRDGIELGIDRQRAECIRLCEQRGFTVVHEAVDNNRSATTGERPAYANLLNLIEQRSIDVVVCLRVDRLLRRLTDLEALIELSERTGVQVATCHGEIDLSSSQGRLIGRILASVARNEAELKAERHRAANAQAAAQGKPHGPRRPYGYCADRVTVYEPEATILREMASRVMAGHGYREVAYWLNENGHKTSTGNIFYPISVRNLLLHPRYKGVRTYEGAEYPAIWPPIFDPETWDRLQLTMKLRRERAGNRPHGRKYLLTGLLFCGICGQHLTGMIRQDHPAGPMRRVYVCRSLGDTVRRAGCGKIRRNADALEWWVTECMLYRLDTPDLGKLLSDSQEDAGSLQALLADRQAQLDRLNGLVDDYATGLLTRAEYARASQTAKAELGRIEKAIAASSRSNAATRLVPVGQSIREAWESSPSQDWKRAILELVIKQVIVNPSPSTAPIVEINGKRMWFSPELVDIVWRA